MGAWGSAALGLSLSYRPEHLVGDKTRAKFSYGGDKVYDFRQFTSLVLKMQHLESKCVFF